MKIIGVTGSSGAGKSTVAQRFADFGVPVLDTDRVARQITEPGQKALCELVSYFGGQILDENGRMKRQLVAEMVFGETDPEKKKRKHEKLNEITHKYVTAATEKWLEARTLEGHRACVLDVPLLFESGMDQRCDITVGVTADQETKIARIMRRDSISREMALHRLSAQNSNDFFASHCHYLIDNSKNTPQEALDRAVMAILKQISDTE